MFPLRAFATSELRITPFGVAFQQAHKRYRVTARSMPGFITSNLGELQRQVFLFSASSFSEYHGKRSLMFSERLRCLRKRRGRALRANRVTQRAAVEISRAQIQFFCVPGRKRASNLLALPGRGEFHHRVALRLSDLSGLAKARKSCGYSFTGQRRIRGKSCRLRSPYRSHLLLQGSVLIGMSACNQPDWRPTPPCRLLRSRSAALPGHGRHYHQSVPLTRSHSNTIVGAERVVPRALTHSPSI